MQILDNKLIGKFWKQMRYDQMETALRAYLKAGNLENLQAREEARQALLGRILNNN